MGPAAAGRRRPAGAVLAGPDGPRPGAVRGGREAGAGLRPQPVRHGGGPGGLCRGGGGGVGPGGGIVGDPVPQAGGGAELRRSHGPGADQGYPGKMQKTDGKAPGAAPGLQRRPVGRHGPGMAGGAGAVRPGGGLLRRLYCRKAPPEPAGFCRSGAPGGGPADGGRGPHRAGGAVERPLRRGDGGRVPGHQRGAERHLSGCLRRRAEALPGGGREAVHLPLPPGRPHHFFGEVPHLPARGRGGGGGAPPHPADPELPLPAPGAGGGQRPVPRPDVPGVRGDGLRPG